MDSFMTHLQGAVAMGEEFVDRNPNFCLTSEWCETRVWRKPMCPLKCSIDRLIEKERGRGRRLPHHHRGGRLRPASTCTCARSSRTDDVCCVIAGFSRCALAAGRYFCVGDTHQTSRLCSVHGAEETDKRGGDRRDISCERRREGVCGMQTEGTRLFSLWCLESDSEAVHKRLHRRLREPVLVARGLAPERDLETDSERKCDHGTRSSLYLVSLRR